MASVDFLQKPFELAKSSQQVIERLLDISQENARLYVSVTSALSSFAVLYDFIVYEASIRVAIQGFALARFELLFPAYVEIEAKTPPETEPSPFWFGTPAISLLLNVSLAQAALPWPESASSAFLESQKQAMRIASVASESKSVLLEKTGFEDLATLTFPTPREIPEIEEVKAVKPRAAIRPAEHEVKHLIIEEQVEEPRQETLLRWVVAIQRQLMARLAPTLEAESSAVLESQKRLIPKALVSLGARTALPDEFVGEKVEAPHVVVPEEKMGRVSIPKIALEAAKEEPSRLERAVPTETMGKATVSPLLTAEVKEEPPKIGLPSAPPSPAVAVKGAPELPELMAYVYGLPTLILESQKPSPTAFAAPTTTPTGQIEPLTDTSAVPSFLPAAPEAPGIGPKKMALPSTSWVARILLPILESIRDLSTFPITTSTAQRLMAYTLTQRIPSPEATRIPGAEKAPMRRAPAGTDIKAEEREIEAIRLPFILATVLSPYFTKSPTTFAELPVRKPFVGQEYVVEGTRKKQFYPEPTVSEQPYVASELEEEKVFSNLQVSRALATAEKMRKEKLKYEPVSFIEELQKARAMYGMEMSDLVAAGPIRATMLDELAPGVLVPSVVEQYLPEEFVPSEVSERPAFPSQPSASTQLAHVFPEEESININVFKETADEDLRELERKVGKILSEQLAYSGTVGSLRTAMLGESSFGLGGLGAAGLSALESQAIPSSLLRQVNVSEGTINLRVFTEAADEDLRELERKIRRILSAQISRYYGSSKP
jgi:hypothetical protein